MQACVSIAMPKSHQSGIKVPSHFGMSSEKGLLKEEELLDGR